MIKICRAEDGSSFQVNASFRDIERIGSLERFLNQEIGVDEDAILAYLSDGRRLRDENVRELAGAEDQSIYVFNKYYLDVYIDEVLQELHVEPSLQPRVEGAVDTIAATPPLRPVQLATSYVTTAQTHHTTITSLHPSISTQHKALLIAHSSLQLNTLELTSLFSSLSPTFTQSLAAQETLLSGVGADLRLVGKVKIGREFLSAGVRRAIERGEVRERCLGDYVSAGKMRGVEEGCRRTHEELKVAFTETETALVRLKEGTEAVRLAVSDTQLLEEADSCLDRSKGIFDKIVDGATRLEGPVDDADAILQELGQLDTSLREEVRLITDIKNAYTTQQIQTLRHISILNNDLIQLPPALSSLQTSFRTKGAGTGGFGHLKRLHGMVYAYGATVVEIVRRKEFGRFFYGRSQNVLEAMAKLSAQERKRRQVYRGEVHGQLPFDTKGMDEPVPSIEFSVSPAQTHGSESPYSLERNDVDDLLRDLETWEHEENDEGVVSAIRETKVDLVKLVGKIDGMESGWDRIAERSLLSASRLSLSKRRLTEADEQAFQELAEQLHQTRESATHQENMFNEERTALQSEIQNLRSKLDDDAADELERDLHLARAQVESEQSARRILEERNAELSVDLQNQRQALGNALHEATEQTKTAEVLRQELATTRAQFDEVKALENRNAQTAARLLEDQARTLRNLELARTRGEDLESQIQAARSESDSMNKALKEATKEKERLLKLQASEHDRLLRDHIAEADGDRAVLEHQFSELKAVLENTERQLKDTKSQREIADADAVGLREELQRVEHELREARHCERILRDDLKSGRASESDFEQRLEDSSRLVAQILDVAIAFRASHVKAIATAQAISSHPLSKQSNNLGDSAFSASGIRHSPNAIGIGQTDEPSPIDPSDPTTALEILRAFDHDHFLETVAKTGSTIRKWQKQCKEYRERAKGKISFRNFAKGDLALFLPTRNSVSKPWAAFNVSFPHYFLQATGHLAEQLKTREWIVARITSITERVVNHNEPSSNPYGLGDGVKYYMLEVEDWTQPSQTNKRRTSSRRTSSTIATTNDVKPSNLETTEQLQIETPNIPPEPPEVEDSFRPSNRPSHLFNPVRTRANSTPIAGPSSLSRLLAQATTAEQTQEVTIPLPSRSRTPSPTTSPPPPPSPSNYTGSVPRTAGTHLPSPLRPGSRASRISTSSKFSAGRIMPAGSSGHAKATATIALSEQTSIPSSPGASGSGPNSPSPEGSISEGLTNVLNHRRSVTSNHIPRTSPLAATSTGATASATLVNFASSFGVSFGRRKKTEDAKSNNDSPTMPPPVLTAEDNSTGAERTGTGDSAASELLKRF